MIQNETESCYIMLNDAEWAEWYYIKLNDTEWY